jgi:hypothetical protein
MSTDEEDLADGNLITPDLFDPPLNLSMRWSTLAARGNFTYWGHGFLHHF